MTSAIVSLFRRRILIEIRRWYGKYAKFSLQRQPELWRELNEYTQKSSSTGCSMTDYFVLYKQIRTLKPVEVLECGTGISTLLIAHALIENEKETGKVGRVTSMEECLEWAAMAKELLPGIYRNNVEILVSPTVEDYYSIFRGMRYRDIPRREYDFVFIDGPNYRSPRDNQMTFDFDYLHILRNSKVPLAGLIDQRVSTVFVLQQLLGNEKVRYSSALGLCFLSRCSADDLGQLANDLSSVNFAPSFRVLSQPRLSMHPII